jgi:hypothetical protein
VRRFALDHLERDAGAREHPRERQAGDPAPDDQDAPSAHRFTDRRARRRNSSIAAGTSPTRRRESSSAGAIACHGTVSSRQALRLVPPAWSAEISNDDPDPGSHRYLAYFM